MKKIIGNKHYISLDDILYMNSSNNSKIPASLCKKIHQNDITIDNEEEIYIELNEEEIDFVESQNYIYSKNYLDILSYEQLLEELESIKKAIEKPHDILSVKNNKYKFNTLIDYINKNIEKTCKTCENLDCLIPVESRIGLDAEGKEFGTDCPNYKNSVIKTKKYTL